VLDFPVGVAGEVVFAEFEGDDLGGGAEGAGFDGAARGAVVVTVPETVRTSALESLTGFNVILRVRVPGLAWSMTAVTSSDMSCDASRARAPRPISARMSPMGR